MAFVSVGTQYEVGNFQVVFHQGDDVETIIDSTLDRINKDFADYNQYRIVSVQYRGGNYSKRIMVQEPSTEQFKGSEMAEKLSKHLTGAAATHLPPVVIEIRLFVAYDEPKL